MWEVSKARCQEQIPTQWHGLWYHSPREEVLGEDQVWGRGEDHECELRRARFKVPFRLPEGDPEMYSRTAEQGREVRWLIQAVRPMCTLEHRRLQGISRVMMS